MDSLSQISSLRFIFASDAPFSDVSKLTQLPELAYLDIRGTEVFIFVISLPILVRRLGNKTARI